jgi:hypothetical protein
MNEINCVYLIENDFNNKKYRKNHKEEIQEIINKNREELKEIPIL